MNFGFTTKDVLAVMVVGASLVFNGISLWFGKELDAGTIGMAGLIVGHYFQTPVGLSTIRVQDPPLPEPAIGDSD